MSKRKAPARVPSFEEWKGAITPCRYYVPGPLPDGTLGWKIGTVPDTVELTERMTDQNRIESSHIESLFRAENLPYNDSDLNLLCYFLNIMRVTCHGDEGVPREILDRYLSVNRAIAVILDNLPMMIGHAKHAVQDALSSNKAAFPAKAVDLEAFLQATSTADQYFTYEGPGKRTAPWHADAAAIKAILANIFKREGMTITFSKPDKPAVRFIDEALKLAGVAHEGLDAISRALSRLAKNQNKNNRG